MGESGTREDPTRPKGTRPPPPTDREGFRKRGEGDLDELEKETGGQEVWRLTDQEFVGERSGRKEGREIIGSR